MPSFKYRARSARGDLLEGSVEAPSVKLAASQLLDGGLTPIDLVENDSPAPSGFSVMRVLGAHRPTLNELTLLCRQLHTLMRSGVPIVRGINSLVESTRNPVLREILDAVRVDLESGRELSFALARYPEVFSNLFSSMVKVGENTGRLDEAFMRIGQYLDLERETRDRIKAALRYPSFVVIAIGIALAIINVLVIPAFADVFERLSVDLPWATRLLIGVSDFTVQYGAYIGGGLVAALIAWLRYIDTEPGRYRWDRLKLSIPVVGSILHRATLARFARAFSMASRSGVPLIQALTIVSRAVDNEYIGDRVLQMRNGIERGETLSRTASGTGLFTPLVLQMIAVGEETGAVDDLLEEVAGFYEREVDTDLVNLSSAIEPVLIVAVGTMVLVLALGVFLPMWDLASGAVR